MSEPKKITMAEARELFKTKGNYIILGYTNLVDFGGILDWTGEIEK